MAKRTGTSKNDIMIGNSEADILFGLNGNDRVFGRSGNDTLDGGAAMTAFRERRVMIGFSVVPAMM